MAVPILVVSNLFIVVHFIREVIILRVGRVSKRYDLEIGDPCHFLVLKDIVAMSFGPSVILFDLDLSFLFVHLYNSVGNFGSLPTLKKGRDT